jgi:pimeloyl-ACP methyl ester carboxylesterase
VRAIGAWFAVFLLLAAGSGAASQKADPALDAYLKPQTLATLPDGRHIDLFCMGQGRPVAIVAPGWHITAPVWHRFQPLMAKVTRVCLYDRAGYNFSDPGPMPRDTAAEVEDLHGALQAAHIQGPFILVGHSLGGFDARLFAYTYPQETAGLLLLDPPNENIYRRMHLPPDEDVALYAGCAKLVRQHPLGWDSKCIDLRPRTNWPAAVRAKVLADQQHPYWYETIVSEDMNMVTRSADELAAARRPLGAIPLILLQADTNCAGVDPKSFDAKRCAELESQAQDSTRGVKRIVAGASHDIQGDKPDVVLGAFREIVQAARASGLATAEPK